MMANERYVLAVDIGSTNIKARIYDGKFKVQASNSKKVHNFFNDSLFIAKSFIFFYTHIWEKYSRIDQVKFLKYSR